MSDASSGAIISGPGPISMLNLPTGIAIGADPMTWSPTNRPGEMATPQMQEPNIKPMIHKALNGIKNTIRDPEVSRHIANTVGQVVPRPDIKSIIHGALNGIDGIKSDPALSRRIAGTIGNVVAPFIQPMVNIKRALLDPVTTYAPAPQKVAAKPGSKTQAVPKKPAAKLIAAPKKAPVPVKKKAYVPPPNDEDSQYGGQEGGAFDMFDFTSSTAPPTSVGPMQQDYAMPLGPDYAMPLGPLAKATQQAPYGISQSVPYGIPQQVPYGIPQQVPYGITQAQQFVSKGRPEPKPKPAAATPKMIATTTPPALQRVLSSLSNIEKYLSSVGNINAAADNMNKNLKELLTVTKAATPATPSVAENTNAEATEETNNSQEGGRRRHRRQTKGRGRRQTKGSKGRGSRRR